MSLSEVRHLAAEFSTSRLVNILSRTKLTPNALTLAGLALSGAAAGVIATERLLLGGLLVLLSGVFDLLDGPLARARGQTSKFGAVLDSTSDRLGEAAVLLGVLILYVDKQSVLEPILAFTTFAASVLVSYIRARAEGLGIECEVGIFTRAERVIILSLGLMLTPWQEEAMFVTLCVLTAFALITVAQRLIYVRQQAQKGA